MSDPKDPPSLRLVSATPLAPEPTPRSPDPLALIWLDLETTGLDPFDNTILEAAIAVAPFRDPTHVQGAWSGCRHWSPLKVMHKDIDPFVIAMHTKSGLWDDCFDSPHRLSDLEDFLLFLVPVTDQKEAKPILAGNSVHFDLAFIRAHMPRLATHLSHRVYDVSALTLYCRSLGMPPFPKAEKHRALADIKDSIAQWHACTEWLRHGIWIADAQQMTGRKVP